MNEYAGQQRPGRPRVDSEAVNTRINREVLRALDVYVARNPVKNRQGAIIAILKSHLSVEDAQ